MQNSPRTTVIWIVIIIVVILGIGAYALSQHGTSMSMTNVTGTSSASSTESLADILAASSTLNTPAEGTMPRAVATTTASSTGSSTSSKTTVTQQGSPSILTSSSNVSAWETYTNPTYMLSLKYPSYASVRNFLDGKNVSYGIGLTLPSSGTYPQKYFEFTVDTTKTTICDGAPADNSVFTRVNINGNIFLQEVYNENVNGTYSHVVQYILKKNNACYAGTLRLDGATTQVSAQDPVNVGEGQVMEDIMSTVSIK